MKIKMFRKVLQQAEYELGRLSAFGTENGRVYRLRYPVGRGWVYDWMFGVMVGIDIEKDSKAYDKIVFSPHPDRRIGFARASIETAHGKISAGWSYIDSGKVRYELTLPCGVRATVRIDGKEEFTLTGGSHTILV